MTLHTLTVPDDPAELPGWLEQQLMSPGFGEFLAELSAFFPVVSGIEPPCHLLDRWLTVALTEGLRPIPPDVLTQWLRHPQLLTALQERIVLDGGPYWDTVAVGSDDLRDMLARGRQALDRVLAESAGPGGPVVVYGAGRKAGPGMARRGGARGYKLWAVASTGIAAVLAVVVGLLVVREPDEPPVLKSQIAWGWAKPGGLAVDVRTAKDYLNELADNAEEWFLYQPAARSDLGARIAEFRTGCTRLIHSTYGPLSPADKEWLLEQCRAWAKALDGHQQALDGGADVLTVRAGVDETARAVAVALRERARQAK